ncbi:MULTISPECIES: hypothetical protein [Mesorhizobium]|uniref:Uncharacterized protein n=1 Tax=Rhizobium loti TaxID=381 RepID=A0A1A5HUR2_RHILI|nr:MULTISPECIES: hypothetical protein [Mesorhizobium]QGX77834.1 hypothetical protein EB234_13675 [Mesorhizobium japonicum R7A]OBP68491.1 hypothetical protein BAE42_23500 [Mesorhizobium loti]OBP70460.1 hypothetical protein BAE39_22940 [Mesorhizobium loti]OBP88517.1 hypothetical protein BAE41_24480 [Mesorhizobium loti]OBP88985.1 hypothetical protein BAE40_20995 [Mesorhizobium loti]
MIAGVVTSDVCFQESAKPILTAGIGAFSTGSFGPEADWRVRGSEGQKLTFRPVARIDLI